MLNAALLVQEWKRKSGSSDEQISALQSSKDQLLSQVSEGLLARWRAGMCSLMMHVESVHAVASLPAGLKHAS